MRIIFIYVAIVILLSTSINCFDKASAIDTEIDILIEDLRNEDWLVRKVAIDKLGSYGPNAKSAIPALIEALGDENKNVRLTALFVFLDIGPTSIPALIDTLQHHEDPVVREGAVTAISHFKADANEAIPYLIEAFKDGEIGDVPFALSLIGLDALPALLEALENEDHRIRAGAAESLGWLSLSPDLSIPTENLLLLLKDDSMGVRVSAAGALAIINNDANLSLHILLEGLNADEPEVRAKSINYIHFCYVYDSTQNPMDCIPQLIKALGDENDDVHLHAWLALATFPEAIPALIKALKNDDPRIRSGSSKTLSAFQLKAEIAIPALQENLQDVEFDVRYNAALALYRIGYNDKNAVPILIDAINKSKGDLSSSARALGEFGADADGATQILLQNMGETLGEHNFAVILALYKIGYDPEKLLDVLLSELDSPDWLSRYSAIETLGELGTDALIAESKLNEMAECDDNYRVREAAVEAINKIQGS